MCGFLVTTDEKIKEEDFKLSFEKIKYRGPDSTVIKLIANNGPRIGFHRLSIIDLTSAGDQPFNSPSGEVSLVCNGEIYNHRVIRSDYESSYQFQSHSDCEVLLPLYLEYGIEKLCQIIDAEFALVLFDEKEDQVIAARDPMGIRPLFYGHTSLGKICFASEVKALIDFCDEVHPVKPGHYYKDGKFTSYQDLSEVSKFIDVSRNEAKKGIHDRLVSAVKKRLDSDASVGFLLSGGLDSSLVCAIAAKISDKPITTFSVGITDNPIDTKYAKVVADYLQTDHHEYLFTKEQTLETLDELIYHLETWDITTIRAAMGMYLICKYIKKETDIKVILTGEVSDEIFGYKYTDYAPSEEDFQEEAAKRVRELFLYDVLRADRSISAHSLEARVPFSDKGFVSYVMSLPPSLKMNTTGVGKHLLRQAFEDEDYLPKDILYREKAAFSDAVGHSMVDWLKEYAESQYTEEEFQKKISAFKGVKPFTKESLFYREIFEKHFSGKSDLIPDYWMPNKEWENCDVDDPSARVLPNYGGSGE